MKLAVFTDIHGNLEALKAIINDIKSKNVDEIICLGDTIGLGSESKECLDLIIENNIKMVLGNHELCALYGTDIDSSINSNVQKEHYKWIRESLTTKEIDFLKKCPLYYECNISYNNIIKNKKIIFSHYLLEDTSKLYPFEKNNLKNDVNLWIKYNNEDITYIVGHLHKSFNENEVDGISGDYIEAIDELTNIFILDSSGCTIDNNTSYMLIDINKSLKFSKINLTYDYNKFINKELEKEIADEKTGISYTLVGDYYLPNLKLEQEEKVQLNKYGLLRLDYLKKHKKAELSIMFMDMTLNKHLKEVQELAQTRVNELVEQLKAKSGLTEDMKNTDMLYWVGTMNAIKNQAEEIVLKELIYV